MAPSKPSPQTKLAIDGIAATSTDAILAASTASLKRSLERMKHTRALLASTARRLGLEEQERPATTMSLFATTTTSQSAPDRLLEHSVVKPPVPSLVSAQAVVRIAGVTVSTATSSTATHHDLRPVDPTWGQLEEAPPAHRPPALVPFRVAGCLAEPFPGDLAGTQLERTAESLAAQVQSTDTAAERLKRLSDSWSTFRSVVTAGSASSLHCKAHLLSAHKVFGEMQDPSKASRARHGVVSAQVVYCKEAPSETQADADQVFDKIPQTGVGADVNKRKVLSVTIHRMLYPITVSDLHQVFGAYGVVLNLSVAGTLGYCEVLVQYNTCEGASQAMAGLQGRCIYDGCCQLDIKGADLSQLSVLEKSCSMQSKLPSVTTTQKQIPKFDGTNMTKWRAGCEEYFELYKIPRVMWIIAAQMNMLGDAALWLQAYKGKNDIDAWEDLCAAMLHAFGPGSDQKLLDSAEERHGTDDNETLNVQSATSHDSVYSQTQEFCSDSTNEVCDAVLLGDVFRSDEVLTHVGGLSLFLEFALDLNVASADDVLHDELPWKGHALHPWSNTREGHVFSSGHNGASSSYLVMDAGLPWSPSGFSPGYFEQPHLGMNIHDEGDALYSKQLSKLQVQLPWEWDPGDIHISILCPRYDQPILCVALGLPWDPGIVAIRLWVPEAAFNMMITRAMVATGQSWLRQGSCCAIWNYHLRLPDHAIAWGQAMFFGGGIVPPGTIGVVGLDVRDHGPGGHGLATPVGDYKRSSSIPREASKKSEEEQNQLCPLPLFLCCSLCSEIRRSRSCLTSAIIPARGRT